MTTDLAPGTPVNSLPAQPLDVVSPAAALTPISGGSAPSAGSGAEPGYQTTEFSTSLAVSLVGLGVTLGVVKVAPQTIQEIVGLVALVGPQLAYAISRGIRKRGTPG